RARMLHRAPKDVAVLKAAYPIQTADRKVNWVGNGNGRAFDRARTAVANSHGGLDLLGGYHSHTGGDAHAGLSRLDLDYILDEFHAMNRGLEEPAHDRWLELVLAIRRREYTRSHEVRWTLSHYPRKLGARVLLTPTVGFDITLAGYWVYCQKDGRPGAFELAGREEARLHAPWFEPR
ncbi:MAG TPA: hypothetical protein VK723_02685, partial [Thermoplasmata archaeon]|nr:hypothetical protein [Thermoplasmata archaeon]